MGPFQQWKSWKRLEKKLEVLWVLKKAYKLCKTSDAKFVLEGDNQVMTVEQTTGLFINPLMVEICGVYLEHASNASLAFLTLLVRHSHPKASIVTSTFHEGRISNESHVQRSSEGRVSTSLRSAPKRRQ